MPAVFSRRPVASSGFARIRGSLRLLGLVGLLGLAGLQLGALDALPAAAGGHHPKVSNSSKATAGALRALSQKMSKGGGKTFTATYHATGFGKNLTVTISQAPPKSAFSTATGSFIDTGSATYFCSTAHGQNTCLSAGTEDPLASVISLFQPSTYEALLNSTAGALAAKEHGYSVTTSSTSIGGQSVTCATVHSAKGNGKYCVNSAGVLAYAGTASKYLELSSYSSSVPSSAFALPSGATVETLPSTVKLPTGVTLPKGVNIP